MKNIFVGNLDFGATEESIRKLFEKYGRVEDVRVELDPESGKSRGFAFVEMSSDADAERATARTKGQLKTVELKGPALTLRAGVKSKDTLPRASRTGLRSKSPAPVTASTKGSRQKQEIGRSEVNVAGTEVQTVDLDGIVDVTSRAIEVFGNREKAIRWLRMPLPSLSNRTPLSLLKTADGIEQIEDVLGRIEQGVW
jgi:RNA recognition motif-containing protein/antitoxin Xre/MbcA/ParS-like protein